MQPCEVDKSTGLAKKSVGVYVARSPVDIPDLSSLEEISPQRELPVPWVSTPRLVSYTYGWPINPLPIKENVFNRLERLAFTQRKLYAWPARCCSFETVHDPLSASGNSAAGGGRGGR
ncbi:hypothetical protein RRG08_039384 [Elysia crispata]|uniref:Uncharacterized protein n=1 Tax=Elysia crispata TaxID=231223 RepID=A0AAE0XV34_9GAST|nr:hypothetical protein RRG08_039384 [Elysia crispata]